MAISLRAVLKSQYRAALAMLRQAVDLCPAELWDADPGAKAKPFWQVAYHALFYAHLYAQQSEKAFRPWKDQQRDSQFLTRRKLLAYWRFCDAGIGGWVDRLDLETPQCGFWWYRMSTLEHQFVNIRHIQHHAAVLADRVRRAGGKGVKWVGGQPAKRPRRK